MQLGVVETVKETETHKKLNELKIVNIMIKLFLRVRIIKVFQKSETNLVIYRKKKYKGNRLKPG